MDPTIMAAAAAAASAVSAGAVAGLTETAKQAVTDAYQKVKGVIGRKYPSVDLAVVEARPEAKSRHLVLAEELTEAGAGADPELAAMVQQLWQVIEEHTPTVSGLVGVRLTRVQAGELEISGIAAAGASGVIADTVQVDGKFSVTDVRVTSEFPHPR
ncbi:hypothetical protein ACRS5S_09285 [Nocardia asiatica]|uniref:hypothetical protein n=1 Tax=Nocardia asiatica TaxID=209252 RepID=UPI0024584F1D|nr:hypothetical protein [Nocardia asiatica]